MSTSKEAVRLPSSGSTPSACRPLADSPGMSYLAFSVSSSSIGSFS